MKLTYSQYQALRILRDQGGDGTILPREFAQAMWPDSPGWQRICKAGNYGVTVGGGMNLAGGAYLGRLRQKGWTIWVSAYRGHKLSDTGRRVLEAHEEMLGTSTVEEKEE